MAKLIIKIAQITTRITEHANCSRYATFQGNPVNYFFLTQSDIFVYLRRLIIQESRLKSLLMFTSRVLLPVAGLLLLSCQNQRDDEDTLMESPDTIRTSVLNVGGELFSVPSPIQTALLIQKSGASYDRSMLNPPQRVSSYVTDVSRALNLGIYGADLGYVSLYNQAQDALSYLGSIKQITDKLGLSAAFDEGTMRRIRDNITNKDSMMTLVGLAYRASDAYLKNNRRNETGSQILAGGWIESMHFSMEAYKNNPSNQIRYRIAEQKQGLRSLMKILANQEDEEVKEVYRQLEGIAAVYDDIKFHYTFAEPKTDTAKKVTYINSTTEITVSDEQLERIAEKVKKLRDHITNLTADKS